MVTARRNPQSGRYQLTGADDAFTSILNDYLDTLATRGSSSLTIRSYAFALVPFHHWFTRQDKALEELQQCDLVPYIAELRASGVQPRTINHRLTVARSLYKFVAGRPMKPDRGGEQEARDPRRGHYDRELGLQWVRARRSQVLRVKTPQTLIVPLTPSQIENLLKSFHRYRDLAIVHMMLLCGLRSREVLAVCIDDINTADRCLRVRGKGRKERLVPMPTLLETTLIRYLRFERPRKCRSEQLFVVLQGKRRGRAMTAAGLRSLFRARRRDFRLQNANPHRLRHTFGADMARAGVSLAVLQRLMGHVYPETTMGYVALSMHDVNEAYHRALETITHGRSK